MKVANAARLLVFCLLLPVHPPSWGADPPPPGSVPSRAAEDAAAPGTARAAPVPTADKPAPPPRPVTPCAIPVGEGDKTATQAIQEAVDAVYAAAAPGAGRAQLNELAFKLIQLAKSGEKNPPICDRAPIDKLALDGSRDHHSRGESVLTAAADSGNAEVIRLTLQAVQLGGGDVYATDYCGNAPYQLLRPGVPEDLQKSLNPNKYEYGRLHDCGDHVVPLIAKKDANPPAKDYALPFTIQALSTTSPVAPDTYNADEPIHIPAYITSLLNANQGVSLTAQSSHGVNTPSFRGELRVIPNDFKRDYLPSGHPFVFLDGNVGPKGGGNPQFFSTGLGWTSSIDLMPLFAPFVPEANAERGHDTVTWLTSTYRAGIIQNRLYNENLYYRFANASYTWFAPFPYKIKGGYYLYAGLTGGVQAQEQYGGGTPTAAELTGNQTYTVPRDYTFGRVDLHGYPCGLISELYTCPAAISKMTFYADEQWVSRYSGSLLEFGATFPLPLQKGISLVLSRTIGHRDPLSSFGVLQSNKVVETDLALTVSFP
ncbi:MAG TPA: hypothetical protein VH105_08580 [Burkholderiales bacterium]|nr:hypothetical protein [Burkholderiales bacterium]